jgi:hypothetical protein
LNVFFLEAAEPLTKRFVRATDGTIQTDSYPHVVHFKSHVEEITSVHALYDAIQKHATLGHCLLKGQLLKPLNFESRAGSTNSETPTELLILDVDGLPDHTPERIMNKMHMSHVDYVLQYSASQGVIPKKGLSCHIFILLDRPVLPSLIKEWLTEQNLEHFQDYIVLTPSGSALHFPIDITAGQNDKLIYIAPPICIPPELDSLNQSRIQIVVKD